MKRLTFSPLIPAHTRAYAWRVRSMKKRWISAAMTLILLLAHAPSALAWYEPVDPYMIRADFSQKDNDVIEATFSIDTAEEVEYRFAIGVEGIMVIDDNGVNRNVVQISGVKGSRLSDAKVRIRFVPQGTVDGFFDQAGPAWTVRVSAQRDGYTPITYEETLHLDNTNSIYSERQVQNSFANGAGEERYNPALPVVVSMGDSYASGEGCPPFYGSGDGKSALELIDDVDWLGHRSKNAWSGQLKFPDENGNEVEINNFKDSNWFFTAVSGALTSDIDGQQCKDYSVTDGLLGRKYKGRAWLPRQIDVFDELKRRKDPETGKPLKADYVTLSLGGNDVGFVDELKTALKENQFLLGGQDFHTLKEEIAGLFSALPSQQLDSILEFMDGLEPARRLKDSIRQIMDDFYIPDSYHDKLRGSYIKIANAAGPQAKIIVTGYPQLLEDRIERNTYPDLSNVVNNPGANPSDRLCIMAWNTQGRILFADKDAELLNDACNFLNDKIQEVVNDLRAEGMNIYFVPIAPAFKNPEANIDHSAYSDEPWINPVIVPTLIDDINTWPPLSAYSIHPNLMGVNAYAAEVQKLVDGLEKDAQVTGTVSITDAEGNPVPSEEIEVIFTESSDPNVEYSVVTDENGYYSIQLPRDEYLVAMRRPDTEEYYSVNDRITFDGRSRVDWYGSGSGSYICRDSQFFGLLMRINCYESCTQDFAVYALQEEDLPEGALPVPDGPAVASVDELMDLYLRTIRECCDGEIASEDLPKERGISMLVGRDALDEQSYGGDPLEALGYCFLTQGDEEVLLIGRTYGNEGMVYDAYHIFHGEVKLILQSAENDQFYLDGVRGTVHRIWDGGEGEYYWDDEFHLIRDDTCFSAPEEIYFIPFSQWNADYEEDFDAEYEYYYYEAEDYMEFAEGLPEIWTGPVPEAYRPLLESYADAAALGSDNGQLEGTLWHWMYRYFNGGMDNGAGLENVVGYVLYDLESDGEPELILGITAKDDVIGEGITQVYTISDGQPKQLFDYREELLHAELTMDGLLMVELAVPMDEDSATTAYYRVNCGELDFVEGFGESGWFSDGDEDYYYDGSEDYYYDDGEDYYYDESEDYYYDEDADYYDESEEYYYDEDVDYYDEGEEYYYDEGDGYYYDDDEYGGQTGTIYLLTNAQEAQTGDFMHEQQIDDTERSEIYYRHIPISTLSPYIQPLSRVADRD